jgi:preprotein translocase subunit SecE
VATSESERELLGQVSASPCYRSGMSKENPTTSLSEYYKRFWRQFYREIRKAVWEAVIAIIAILAVVFLQFYYGWINREQGVLSALQNAVPAAVIALAYIVRHLIKTPWGLDVERESDIRNGLAAIDELKGQIERFSSESNRPKFNLTKPTVSDIGEFDEDERYAFTCSLENIGSREASDLVTRVIVVEKGADKKPKVLEMTVANEIAINDPFITQFEMTHSRNDPPVQIVVALKFKDAVTDKSYTQAVFMKWEGLRRGVISEVLHLTSQEREELMRRLGSELDAAN